MSLDQEALFSLEVVVDKLSLPKVACRFPSVAFRLLDFPTLIINHVEPELSDQIKRKILSDPHYKLPLQLRELKDNNNQFPVCKGKTCLLKISPNALNNHLMSTPLYVMVVDTYPDTPKLIGNCTIPMDEVMDNLYDDICKHGVSVPSTHGEKGIHNIYNLMGKHVGKIILGFRLLSLGRSLISHIPDNVITRSKAQAPVSKATEVQSRPVRKLQEDVITEEGEPLIVHDLEAAEKNVQVAIYPEKPGRENALSQTDKDVLQTISTQTAQRKKKAKDNKKLDIKMDNSVYNDLVVTNTECPPPLYFNSDLPDKSPALELLPISGQQHIARKLYANGAYASPDSEDEFSDDSTIREEDKFSDDDDKAFLTSTKKVRVRDITKPPKTAVKKTTITQNAPLSNLGSDLGNMPLLNALMNEILTLQGISPQGQAPRGHTVRSPRSRSPGTREEHDSFLVRMATPRSARQREPQQRAASPAGSARRGVPEQHKPRNVPKNKSWLRPDTRKDPASPAAVKKTKLFSGMTNTQRLRLAKTNPELLRELEQKEEERLGHLPKPRRPYSARGREQQQQGGVSGREEAHRPPPLDLAGLRDQEHHPHKKPVPTPRHSISFKSTGPLVSPPPITPRASISRRPPGYPRNPRPDSEQSGSIDVHVPTVSNGYYDDEDDDLYRHDNGGADAGRDLDLASRDLGGGRKVMGRTRVINSPGFPRSSVDSRASSQPLSAAYSEDFEPSTYGGDTQTGGYTGRDTGRDGEGYTGRDGEGYTGRDPGDTGEEGLRRGVDHYSDDYEEDDTTGYHGDSAAGEVPDLRMMVDRYTDDESVSRRSQRSPAGSYVSARSHVSMDSRHSRVPNPTSSLRSPSPVPKSGHPPGMATREPVAASSTLGATSGESTAYIPRSAVSPESTEERPRTSRGRIRPRPSPRQASIRTDSVSSYAPSDGEEMSHSGDYVMSDVSEEDAEYAEIRKKLQLAKEARLSAEAKFGYTWTPS